MPKPPTLHTLQSIFAQTEPEGDCLIWQGYTDSTNGRAEVYVGPPISRRGAMWQVRRLVAWLSGCRVTIAQAKRAGRSGSVYSTTCGHPHCIAPDHIVRRTRTEHARVMSQAIPPAQRVVMAIQIKRTQQAKPYALTPEQRQDAMYSTDSLGAAARRIGCSKSTIARLRLDAKNAANPFAQLLRHTGTLPNARHGTFVAMSTTQRTPEAGP